MKRIFLIIISLFIWSAAVQAQCDEGANCSITISGTDGYGDGWNGASIAIWQDTIFRGTFPSSRGCDASFSFWS